MIIERGRAKGQPLSEHNCLQRTTRGLTGVLSGALTQEWAVSLPTKTGTWAITRGVNTYPAGV